jgi:hypothetical protein
MQDSESEPPPPPYHETAPSGYSPVDIEHIIEQCSQPPSIAEQLRCLADLHSQGALSAEEFTAAKRVLLAPAASPGQELQGKSQEKPEAKSNGVEQRGYLDTKRARDRSRDHMFVRVTGSFWPEFDGLYHPQGAWDGLPEWCQLSAEDEAKQRVPAEGQQKGRNGIWWRKEGHWRIGRRNHYFFIADGDKDGTYPPVADWEAAYGFYRRKGKKAVADKYCQKGHPSLRILGKKPVKVKLAWEYPFGHPERS